jgi:hypothetical protein
MKNNDKKYSVSRFEFFPAVSLLRGFGKKQLHISWLHRFYIINL